MKISINDMNPDIRFVRYISLNSGFSFINRRIYDYHFLYIYSGSASVIVEGENYKGQKGDLFFWGPNTSHSLINDGPSQLNIISIRFDFYPIDDYREVYQYYLTDKEAHQERKVEVVAFKDFDGFPCHIPMFHNDKIEKLLNEMVQVYNSKESFYQIRLKGIFMTFISELIGGSLPSTQPHEKSNLTIQKLIQNIEKNYMKNITNEFLADQYNYNPNHLNRLMKEVTGMSIHQYITSIKLNKAIELLNTTDMKMNEIAKMVGYHDTSYFCRIFRKKIGLSPTKYKEKIFEI